MRLMISLTVFLGFTLLLYFVMVPLSRSAPVLTEIAYKHDLAPSSLDSQVLDVLRTNCAACHDSSVAEKIRGGIDGLLNLSGLANDRGMVVPGEPNRSFLYEVLIADPDDIDIEFMPRDIKNHRDDGERLSDQEIKVVHDWIVSLGDLNSKSTKRFISHTEVDDLIAKDLISMSDATAFESVRYFSFVELHNSESVDDSRLSLYRIGLKKLLNSLTFLDSVVDPVPIGGDQLLYRVDIVKDLGWSPNRWDELVAAYPYGIDRTTGASAAQRLTGTLPVLRADWFVFMASQPPFYERLLGLPVGDDSLNLLERTLGLDREAAIRVGQPIRAGFTESGVSQHNRLIERHDLRDGGYYWISYDFASSTGSQDLIKNPLGPAGVISQTKRGFAHDGGEVIFTLPNGFQAYALVDAVGGSLAVGPSEIVHDSANTRGGFIINGISCIACHANGMRNIKQNGGDQVSRVSWRLPGITSTDEAHIRRLYPGQAEVQRAIDADARAFENALRRAGLGVTAEEPVRAVFEQFMSPVGLSTAAAELAVPLDELRARLELSARGQELLLRLELGVKRELFLQVFTEIVTLAELGKPRQFVPVQVPTFDPKAASVVSSNAEEYAAAIAERNEKMERDAIASAKADIERQRERARARELELEQASLAEVRELAQRGDHFGAAELARRMIEGIGMPTDELGALPWARSSAEAGNALGQSRLGRLYDLGIGVPQSDEEAVKWFRLSAIQGNKYGQVNLGYHYTEGYKLADGSVRRNEASGLDYTRLAADQGLPIAQWNLGLAYEKGKLVDQDYAKALAFFHAAAEQGLVLAQNELGEWYYDGKHVTQDFREAAKWYQMSAAQSDSIGQYKLSVLYYKGEGVEQSDDKSIQLLRLSEAQGYNPSRYGLAGRYYQGHGVPQSDSEGFKWLRLSATQQDSDPQYIYDYGRAYWNGRGVSKSDSEGLKWIRKAADLGYADAQYFLGRAYEDGRGVVKNTSQAIKWIQLAARQGHEDAQNWLSERGLNW